jgi:hypothetical protein
MPPGELIIEIQRIGAILRVAAVDVATGTEVTFQAPATASRASINRLAANKLRYVMVKGATPPEDSTRGGIVPPSEA